MAAPKTKRGVVMFANSERGLTIAQEIVGEAMGVESPAFGCLKYDRRKR